MDYDYTNYQRSEGEQMNNLDFTKIRWAGGDCILITARDTRQAIILTKYEIECLIKEYSSNTKKKNKGGKTNEKRI